jgi:RNA ligase (TIGR02306 family)
MRKLATIRTIDELRPIPGADAIECAVVGGWTVVVKKGEFTAGDAAVYCEIDSWIPTALAPFLSKGAEPRVFDGIAGERLRTVKLRGQLSQGLLLNYWDFPEVVTAFHKTRLADSGLFDVTELLGIVKYEAPVPAQLAGEVKGLFPGWIQKTDQERVQNLKEELEHWKSEQHLWEITEKLDGSSMTVYLRDGEFGVCSRNLELKPNPDNSLWKVALRNDLEGKLRALGRNVALQGELIGEGIQGNPYKIRGQEFYLFDVYDIDRSCYFTPDQRKSLALEHNINHVPVFGTYETNDSTTIESLLQYAEGNSVMGDIVGPTREGLVFKSQTMQCSFKAISNKFLLKGGN